MHQLKATQNLPISLEEAWDFFSSPHNLSVITPEYLDFVIKSELPEKMHPGMMIVYTVRPLLSIPLTWVTEITHVENLKFFVDEQRVGPYKIWHHQHHFRSVSGGVEMSDVVDYKLPLGALGKIFHPFLVQPKLEEIFAFRRDKLKEIFGDVKQGKEELKFS